MTCALCGKVMVRRADGAWDACCNGVGYWYDKPPLARDSWWPVVAKGGCTLYTSTKWDQLNKVSRL